VIRSKSANKCIKKISHSYSTSADVLDYMTAIHTSVTCQQELFDNQS